MANSRDLKLMIRALEELGELDTEAAPEVAREIQDVLLANDRAHVDPYGKPWPLRKADGATALDHAPRALTVSAIKNKILIVLKWWPYGLHHRGVSRGKVERKQIPTDKVLPQNLQEAITRALTRQFNRTVAK